MSANRLPASGTEAPAAAPARPPRIQSIDALRGFVMFTMIFVNDLAGNDKIVPDWMAHYSDRHASGSGMTFVDLVFPGFLFLVGMSIPFAVGGRLARGESWWRILGHVCGRTLALLFLGIMMVNESPDTRAMGWSATLWTGLLYGAAILAFGELAPPGGAPNPLPWRWISRGLRVAGLATLAWLACVFRGKSHHQIIAFSPFSIHHEWYGILGLIGWAYLVASVIYLLFGNCRTALLGCLALLMCLYPADKAGSLDGWGLGHWVSIGETLGAQPAITVAGVLLGTILLTAETATVVARVRFTLLFAAGFAAAALLTNGLYGISKNNATPAWCFWSCTVTGALWLAFYLVTDVAGWTWLARPWVVAGQNVLLAYLISEGLESWLSLLHLDDWYDNLAATSLTGACGRGVGCALFILAATAGLNRAGFRVKL